MAETYSAADGPYPELTKEACDRLGACEAQKREFDLDIREAYFFAQPHRAREIRSEQVASPNKPTDEGEVQTGIASELVEDFQTELINGFMPPQAPFWAERKPGAFIPNEARATVEQQAKAEDAKIFEAIRASNLYEEMPKCGADPAIGTAALWIDDPRPAESIVVQAIPLHELEINLGPFGAIDDRFVVRHTKNRHVKALLGSVYDNLDPECRKDIEDPKKSHLTTILRWGYWRLWVRVDDVVWQHVVMKDKKVIHTATLVGEGSCPLIPFRFNPSPEWAYGQGPLINALPDLRVFDDLRTKMLENVDLSLSPPFTFPDSSSTAWGNLESGKGYPVRPGDEGAVKNIFDPGPIEPSIYQTEELERALRRRFYVDLPQQRGDTPPTATQWLDEMQLALRRFGTPGASFWREGPAEFFLRFKYLLERRGVAQPIKVDGKTVQLRAFNPAQRAAEMEQVAMAARYLSMVMPTFPEEARLKIDGSATMEKMAEKMRVKDLIVFRDKETIGNVVDGIKQLAEGRQQVRPGDPGLVRP